MAIVTFSPFPIHDPMTESASASKLEPEIQAALADMKITRVWVDWLTTVNSRLDSTPTTAQTVGLVTQAASIGTTPIPLPSVAAGYYRVTYYMRVTTAATTSSSLTLILGSTESGVTCTLTTPAMTSNNVTLPQTGTAMLKVDQGSIISYSTIYASSGAVPMVYTLDIVVEAIS